MEIRPAGGTGARRRGDPSRRRSREGVLCGHLMSSLSIGLLGLAFGLSPAVSFDGTRTPEAAPVSSPLPAHDAKSIGRATPLAAEPASPLGVPRAGPALVAVRSPSAPARRRCARARSTRPSSNSNTPPSRAFPAPSGSSAGCMRTAMASSRDKARAFEYFRRLTNHPQADDSVGHAAGALLWPMPS